MPTDTKTPDTSEHFRRDCPKCGSPLTFHGHFRKELLYSCELCEALNGDFETISFPEPDFFERNWEGKLKQIKV